MEGMEVQAAKQGWTLPFTLEVFMTTATQSKEWQDRRSGPVGCLAGNLTLDSIRMSSEEFKRLKGTIFFSDKRLIVGRVCSRQSYLAGSFVHFCNLTSAHHRNLVKFAEGRDIFYLLLTVSGKEIHYWLLPHKVMGQALRKAKPKKSDSACIIRVREHNGKYDMLGVDITQYHQHLVINPSLVRKFSDAEKKSPKSREAVIQVLDGPKDAKVTLRYTDGREYAGVLRMKRNGTNGVH
jgi:hypothetical protein